MAPGGARSTGASSAGPSLAPVSGSRGRSARAFRRPLGLVDAGAPPGAEQLTRAILDTIVGAPAGEPVRFATGRWAEIERWVRRHRIHPFVVDALTEGRVSIPDEAAERLRAWRVKAAARGLALDAELTCVLAALSAEGIDVRVLKGLATRELDHRPGRRVTRDLDLLVERSAFDAACDLISRRAASERKPEAPHDLLVERTFRLPNGIEVDLHHRLFRHGTTAHQGLFDETPEPLPTGHGLALPAHGRMIHAVAHLLLTPPGFRPLASLLDVAAIGAGERLDREALARFAAALDLTDLVAVAEWLVVSIGRDGSAAPTPPPIESTPINRAHVRARRRIDLETRWLLREFDSWPERGRYLAFQAGRLADRVRPRRARREADSS